MHGPVQILRNKIECRVKPLIKDTPKEDKPPNEGQAESTLVYTLYRKSPLKEDNLSTRDKTADPESVLIKRFHCTPSHMHGSVLNLSGVH